MNKILSSAILFLVVNADVPVMCHHDQIAGYIWNFHISKDA